MVHQSGVTISRATGFAHGISKNVARRLCVMASLASVLLACSDAPTDVISSSAVVYGTVTNPAGAPVAGAQAMIDLYFEGCPATSNPLMTSTSQANSAGFYRVVVGAVNLTGPRCIHVSVSANGISLMKEATVSIQPEQNDSIRVDFTLR